MRKTNTAGKELIKKWEGLRLTAYRDAVGVWTIGYGHTGPDVYPGKKITEQEANDLFDKDLAKFEKYVDKPQWAWLNDNQFSALVSLAFNVGSFQAGLSGLLDSKQEQKAADRILQYNKANGIELPGLIARRRDERELFLTPPQKFKVPFLAKLFLLFAVSAK